MINKKIIKKIYKNKITMPIAVTGITLLIAGFLVMHIRHGSAQGTVYAQATASGSSSSSSSGGSPSSTSTGSGSSSSAPAATSGAAAQTSKAASAASSSSAAAAPKKPAAVSSSSPAPAAPEVNSSLHLYTNPSSDVATQAEAWASANPNDATAMNRLASTPMANWFGDFSGDITSAVNNYVSAASNAGQVPVLVAYNIPERDCGGYSSGGAANASSYETWITQFAQAVGQRNAIVVVEPDALAGMDCLSSSDQQTRLQLISYAVQALRTNSKAAIYLDAGNSSWQSVSVMASRLEAADVASATGFSLNVSGFDTNSSSVAYGNSLSAAIGGKHFVIDTSRNGNGTGDGNWCNPNGTAFGTTPTLQTGSGLIDAYLWIKDPGESDGQCGATQAGTSAPAAGVWWPQYALMLAANSGWN
jgi:endoglucanase